MYFIYVLFNLYFIYLFNQVLRKNYSHTYTHKRTHTRCLWKVTGLTSQFISNPNNKLLCFPFKVIPLVYSSLFYFYKPLERFLWDTPQLHRYGLLDSLHSFKMNPFDDPFDRGERKSHRARSCE